MSQELKLCPFCGREPKIEEHCVSSYPHSFTVSCDRSSCAESYFNRGTKQRAIAAWNRRAKPTGEPK